MSLDSVLAAGQRAAERIMTDTGYARRPDGTTTDPNTGAVTPAYVDVWGSAAAPQKCRVKTSTDVPTGRVIAEQDVNVMHLQLQLPVAASGIKGGDEWVMVSSLDPELVGRTFTIDEQYGQSQATMRRYQIEDV